MLSHDEKQYLTWLASEKYEGWGAIVELGVWLGSSSAALAEGLRRQDTNATIHSFDRFVWESNMSAVGHENLPDDLRDGDDFLPLFMRAVGDYAPRIQAHKVDLLNYTWEGGPIEILFVDSAKTWDLANAILKGFGPHLSPGRSRVVLQDFRYFYAYCLPLIFDSRPDVWKQIEDAEFGHTVTFVPLKPLFGPSGIDTNYLEESFPLASADHLLRSRMAGEEPGNRCRMLRGLYRKYLIDGPLDETRILRQQVLTAGIDEAELEVLENVDVVLLPRGWAAFSSGEYQIARTIAERCLSLPSESSVFVLTLLGFSCLRLGDRAAAEKAMEEATRLDPDHPATGLFRVELAVLDGLYAQAEEEALNVLRSGRADEATIQWAFNLLSEVWRLQGTDILHAETLAALAPFLGESAAFATCLARERSLL